MTAAFQTPGPRDSLTDVAGLLVGHHHERDDDATMGSPDHVVPIVLLR